MHEDRDAVLGSQRLGEPDVVAVAVGEHDAADVGGCEPGSLEHAIEVAPVAAESRVDERRAPALHDEVRGHEVVSHAVESRSDLHEGYGT